MYGTVKKMHQFIFMPYYVAPETRDVPGSIFYLVPGTG